MKIGKTNSYFHFNNFKHNIYVFVHSISKHFKSNRMLSLALQEVLFITISFIITIVFIFLINKYLIQSWFKTILQIFLYLSLTFLVITTIIGVKNLVKAKYFTSILKVAWSKSTPIISSL